MRKLLLPVLLALTSPAPLLLSMPTQAFILVALLVSIIILRPLERHLTQAFCHSI